MTRWVVFFLVVGGLVAWSTRRRTPARRRFASSTETAASAEADSVEIRVHGVGDHDEWSALGTPGLVTEQEDLSPDVALPPSLPDHQLRLINWSRTSRRWAGWLWYVALPYTLVNVAGQMEAPAQRRGVWRLHRAAVMVTGLVLTLLSFLWLVAILETVARVAFVPTALRDQAGRAIAILVAGGLIFGMLHRRRRRPRARTSIPVLLAHVVLVGLAGVLTALLRPAQLQVVTSPALGWATTYSPADDAALRTWERLVSESREPLSCAVAVENGLLVTRLDPLTTSSLAGTALALLLGVLLWSAALVGRRRGLSREASTAVMTSGAVLVMAVLLLTSVASALRLGLDWLLRYASGYPLPGGGAPISSRVVLPSLLTRCGERNDQALDLLPLLGITGALALVMGLLLSAARPSRVGGPPLGRGKQLERARWAHTFITCLPQVLPVGLAVAGTLWVAGSVRLGAVLLVSENLRWWRLGVLVIHVVGAVIVVVVFAGRSFTRTREVFGSIADVLGFWPVRWHPFGGASYRDAVVARIAAEIATPRAGAVVLVGHSQGSVLAAWTIGHPDQEPIPVGQHVCLVTCGSPLHSLYAQFFPSAFDGAFFARVAERVDNRWVNFWRDTDPIATPLPGARPRHALPDPPPDGVLRVHGDYWLEECQENFVKGAIAERQQAAAAAAER